MYFIPAELGCLTTERSIYLTVERESAAPIESNFVRCTLPCDVETSGFRPSSALVSGRLTTCMDCSSELWSPMSRARIAPIRIIVCHINAMATCGREAYSYRRRYSNSSSALSSSNITSRTLSPPVRFGERTLTERSSGAPSMAVSPLDIYHNWVKQKAAAPVNP